MDIRSNHYKRVVFEYKVERFRDEKQRISDITLFKTVNLTSFLSILYYHPTFFFMRFYYLY